MVQVAITKIRKELPGSLKKDFDETFPLPITIFSSYQDLLSFKHERADFVADHASAIDDDLAKRLDNIIVTNSDIQNGLVESGSKFTDVK